MDEQGTHMQLRGLDLKELEAQRAELVPDRIEMKRRWSWRKKGNPVIGIGCLHIVHPDACGPVRMR